MARRLAPKGQQARFACRCQSLRCKPHQRRLRASGNIDRRIKVHPCSPSEKAGYLYIIATEGKKGVKVGFTYCPIARLSNLPGTHGDLRLYKAHKMEAKLARKLERQVHKMLAPWALSMIEWYNVTPRFAASVINELIAPRKVTRGWLYRHKPINEN